MFFLLALVLYHLWANAKSIRLPGRHLGLRKIILLPVIVSLVVGMPLWGYDYAYHPYSKTTVVVEAVVSVNPLTNSSVTTPSTSTVQSDPVTDPVENFVYYFTYQNSL